jgi:serine-type D-Ala-D-Ala carboxypeptidase/endopeptidase
MGILSFALAISRKVALDLGPMLARWLKFSLAVLLAFWLGRCHALCADDYRQIAEKEVETYLADHPQAAVTVGIVDSAGTHVFGFGQLKKSDPANGPDGRTIYQIGSITKTFTCTMLAEQVVLGHLKLADPAQKYLPADLVLPKENAREITLEELATHHSGLPRLPQLAAFFMLGAAIAENPYAGNSWQEMPTMMRTVWLSTPIGKKYGYSNLAMGLLGQALVHATKSADYAELVANRISKPLGMIDTCVDLSEEQNKRLVQGYSSLGLMEPAWDFASLEGAGALYSTVDDLLIFAAANLGLKKTDLAPAMQLAQQPQASRGWGGGPLGLGWHIKEAKDDTEPYCVWHNGMTGGYASMLILVPERKLAVVVLSNVAAGVDDVAEEINEELIEDSKATNDGTNDGAND